MLWHQNHGILMINITDYSCIESMPTLSGLDVEIIASNVNIQDVSKRALQL
jgi:hypothetical protein